MSMLTGTHQLSQRKTRGPNQCTMRDRNKTAMGSEIRDTEKFVGQCGNGAQRMHSAMARKRERAETTGAHVLNKRKRERKRKSMQHQTALEEQMQRKVRSMDDDEKK